MVIDSVSDEPGAPGRMLSDEGSIFPAAASQTNVRTSPLLVGLTGGIGCGKTTVLKVFRQMGVPCFVADEMAGKYYDDSAFLQDIRDLFGEAAFYPDGRADKKAIASIVFHDKEKLLALNALVHPRVMKEFADWTRRQTAPYVVMESAILYEYGLDKELNKIICVYVEQEERLRRLEERDLVSREVLMARMSNQLSAEEKMDRADYVILNYEGNPRGHQVQHIHELLLGQAGITTI